jgi:hypothetical protein
MKAGFAVTVSIVLALMSLMRTDANAAGQTCGGIVPLQCGYDSFCQFKPGQCGRGDMTGLCTPKPAACPQVTSPKLRVCGCDGVTYGNDCMRQQAGTSLAHKGACAKT